MSAYAQWHLRSREFRFVIKLLRSPKVVPNKMLIFLQAFYWGRVVCNHLAIAYHALLAGDFQLRFLQCLTEIKSTKVPL